MSGVNYLEQLGLQSFKDQCFGRNLRGVLNRDPNIVGIILVIAAACFIAIIYLWADESKLMEDFTNETQKTTLPRRIKENE